MPGRRGEAAGGARVAERIHPGLAAALSALDERGLAWLALRGAEAVARTAGGDVDLLVDAREATAVEEVLHGAGFAPVPAPGHGSHRFFVTYDAATGAWLMLDVVTSIDFGAHQELATDLAAALLRRRRRRGRIAEPAGADRLWLLLLHDLLRDGEVAGRRRALVSELARGADGGPVAAWLTSLCPGIDRALVAAVRREDWGAAARLGRRLRRAWLRRHGTAILRRRMSSWWRRRLPGRPSGLSIAVVGPDGAGKTTLAEGLVRTLPIPAAYAYLGIWRQTSWEERVRRVFGAQLALRLAMLAGKAALTAYHRRLGRIVVLDRFTADADLPSGHLDAWARIGARLARRTNPDPDLVLLLDAPGAVMHARSGELDAAELERRRHAYLAMRARHPGIVVLDATQDADAVLRAAAEAVWERWARRAAGRLDAEARRA